MSTFCHLTRSQDSLLPTYFIAVLPGKLSVLSRLRAELP